MDTEETTRFSSSYDKEKSSHSLKMDKGERNGESTKNSSNGTDKSQLAIEERREICKKRCVSHIKIIWSFISFLIAVADVVVIIVVTWLHFVHQHDILAWMMLLPILANFIGIFTFLNNENERSEFEELGGSCRSSTVVKNLMILPVFGPAFSSLRLFFYAIQEEDAEKFERLESLLTKMKQYESFFRAAPEAFIQITYRIVTWSNERKWDYEDHWTTACIALCVFSLSESNFYGVVRMYYRIFTDPDKLPKDAWNTEKISIPWRVLMFLFTYVSIISRLLSDAIFRATMCFIFDQYYHSSFGEVIAISFIMQFVVRTVVHALVLRRRENITLARGTTTTLHHESGPMVYRAFTYSWRSIFMSFDFQSPDIYTAAWFYIENVLIIASAYVGAFCIEYDLSEKNVYFFYTATAAVAMLIAISIKISVKFCYRRHRRISEGDIEQ